MLYGSDGPDETDYPSKQPPPSEYASRNECSDAYGIADYNTDELQKAEWPWDIDFTRAMGGLGFGAVIRCFDLYRRAYRTLAFFRRGKARGGALLRRGALGFSPPAL